MGAQTQTYSQNWENILCQNLSPIGDVEMDGMTVDDYNLLCNDLINSEEIWNPDFLSNLSSEEKTSSGDESPLNSPSLSTDSAFSNDSPLQLSDTCFNVFDECTTSNSSAILNAVPNVHFGVNYGYNPQKSHKPDVLTYSNDLIPKPASSETTLNLHSSVTRTSPVILPVLTDQLAILTTNSAVLESTPTVYTINALPNIISSPTHQIIVTTTNVSSSNFNSRSTKPLASYRTEPYPKIKPKLSVESCDFVETRSVASPWDSRKPSCGQIASTCSNFMPNVGKDDKEGDDELSKMKKRQSRMIKNREHASLSRQKKKEYLDSLEDRLKRYSEENEKLKRENTYLKQTVSKLQNDNDKLRGQPGKAFSPTVHAPFLSSNTSKTVICALTLMFLCAVNLGPYWTYFYPRNLQPSLPQTLTEVDGAFVGRKLLSVSGKTMIDEEAFVQHDPDSIRSKRSPTSFSNDSNIDCNTYFNKSESLRLADELNSWAIRYESIRTKKYEKQTIKGSTSDTNSAKLSDSKERKKKQTVKKLSDIISSQQAVQQWLYDFDNFELESDRVLANRKQTNNPSDLQLYFNEERRYVRFLEALRRRDDTFYVVSFQREYILLPALAHNRTTRPRMSLVMPALPLNESMQPPPNHVAMMQIECEVTGTSLLHLPENVVPKFLRRTKNVHSFEEERVKTHSSTSNGRNSLKNNSKSFNETSLK